MTPASRGGPSLQAFLTSTGGAAVGAHDRRVEVEPRRRGTSSTSRPSPTSRSSSPATSPAGATRKPWAAARPRADRQAYTRRSGAAGESRRHAVVPETGRRRFLSLSPGDRVADRAGSRTTPGAISVPVTTGCASAPLQALRPPPRNAATAPADRGVVALQADPQAEPVRCLFRNAPGGHREPENRPRLRPAFAPTATWPCGRAVHSSNRGTGSDRVAQPSSRHPTGRLARGRRPGAVKRARSRQAESGALRLAPPLISWAALLRRTPGLTSRAEDRRPLTSARGRPAAIQARAAPAWG